MPLRRLNRAQSRAVARLTLATAGRIHEILLPVQTWLVTGVTGSAKNDGNADPTALMGLSNGLNERWHLAMNALKATLEVAREQAASMPFGVLVRHHNSYFAPLQQPIAESAERKAEKSNRICDLAKTLRPIWEKDVALTHEGELPLQEDELTAEDMLPVLRLWQMRREQALRAVAGAIEGDGLNLSQRIWRLGNGGLDRIRATLASAYDGRTNALSLARQIEAELGANADLPRWTTTRLYKMTPSERMADKRGLITDPANRARGVSYNAVRLARTEIQRVNHAVSTEIAKHNPALTGRKVMLSPGHPKIDICDDWASGGPYPKSDEILPLHPNCMCYYLDVLMERGEFDKHVREWLRGEGNFLDDYASWLGMRNPVQTLPYEVPIVEVLDFWLSTSHAAEAVKLLVA